MGGKGITRLWYPRKERVFRWCRNFSLRSSAVLRVSGGLYRLRFYRRDAEDRRGTQRMWQTQTLLFLLFLFGQSRNRHRAFFLVPRDLEREHRALVGCR